MLVASKTDSLLSNWSKACSNKGQCRYPSAGVSNSPGSSYGPNFREWRIPEAQFPRMSLLGFSVNRGARSLYTVPLMEDQCLFTGAAQEQLCSALLIVFGSILWP